MQYRKNNEEDQRTIATLENMDAGKIDAWFNFNCMFFITKNEQFIYFVF